MRVLLIEDEPLSQDEIVRLIERNFPNFAIANIIDSIEDSITWLSQNSVDLIFMDIHLSDGISFQIFESIQINTPIIFTTAYDQYAIQAFEVNGIGYILKPIDEDKFIETVRRFQSNSLFQSNKVVELINNMSNPNKNYKTRIAIKLGDKISFINIDNVAYFYSDDRVTFVVEKNAKKHIVDSSIETLEIMLDPLLFFRVTRGCIASIGSIDTVSKYFNSRLKVTLKPEYEKEVLISRVKVPEFVSWLDGE